MAGRGFAGEGFFPLSERSSTPEVGPRQIKVHCKLNDESQELIRVAMTELNLSAPRLRPHPQKSPGPSPTSPNPTPLPPKTSAKRSNTAPLTERSGSKATGEAIVRDNADFAIVLSSLITRSVIYVNHVYQQGSNLMAFPFRVRYVNHVYER